MKKSKIKKTISAVEPPTERDLFNFNEVSPFTRGLFLRSLFLGGLGLSLGKLGYSSKNQFPEFVKLMNNSKSAISNLTHYYGHDAVLDRYGVIAPWYQQQNGQCDFRIRIAAETLKRYPWTTTKNAVAAYPHYIFTSKWDISPKGEITPLDPGDWMNGDLGQRATSIFKGMVDYYRYSGDPAAIAHINYMAGYVLDYCLTPADHSWPDFPISVPIKGKAYGKANPEGMIQLDICASMGEGLLRAYQLTKNQRWLDSAKHWGDLFAEKCNLDPNAAPWPRYANPESAKWKDDPRGNEQTGGVTMVLAFLDELIRLGYSGKDKKIEAARDAGLRYLRDQLLPQWTLDKTWNFYFWDYLAQNQCCSTTADVAGYLIKHKELFPNWYHDSRNILTLFLNRSSADIHSASDVFNGAWAYPESSACCTRSLWYAPLMVGTVMAQCGVMAEDDLMQELGYRQMILQTYDGHENGLTEDNIDGGVLVNNRWFNIAHPWPLLWLQQAIGWLPEKLGASRENHLVRSGSVVDSIVYGKGNITYTTYDAPQETIDVLRLSFVPVKITADGQKLRKRKDLKANGYTVKKLSNGDTIVLIRHDGKKKISVTGKDPQTLLPDTELKYDGAWKKEKDHSSGSGSIHFSETEGASVSAVFNCNQIRLTGRVDEFGGLADVFIDGVRQNVFIDFWNPDLRGQQILYYNNGLPSGEHTLKIIARGAGNPYSKGRRIYVDTVQFSAETGQDNFPSGTGPAGPQRMIFGYKTQYDYKDAQGNLWRPGTEVITRLERFGDTVARCWMPETKNDISGTADQELYRYGYRASDFWVNVTVGPGKYGVRLKFAATQDASRYQNGFDIIINEKTIVHNLNVIATAKSTNKAVDLVFKNIVPHNGIIQIRFKGLPFPKGNSTENGEAFVQALEIGQNLVGKGAIPVSFS
ncbi:MAG TPA: hypothetical protein DIT07_08195 [Sphingobacteriaceae bacterium]|nr:hypothetical protein [Sphingobacteriaceae bacterium]